MINAMACSTAASRWPWTWPATDESPEVGKTSQEIHVFILGYLGLSWVYLGFILGLSWDCLGFILVFPSWHDSCSRGLNMMIDMMLHHHQMSSVQNPSVFPLNPGWFIWIPRSWIIIVPNMLASIIPNESSTNHHLSGIHPLNNPHIDGSTPINAGWIPIRIIHQPG